MSEKVVDRVFETSTASGTSLVILLALGYLADDDGFCSISIKELAKMVRCCISTIKHCTHNLERSDYTELYVLENAGENYTNVYLVASGMDTPEMRKKIDEWDRKHQGAQPCQH